MLFQRKICELERACHQAAGRQFLVSSHAQLRQVLFDELKLDEGLSNRSKMVKTGSGKQSTSESVLVQLKDNHILPSLVLEHRQVSV